MKTPGSLPAFTTLLLPAILTMGSFCVAGIADSAAEDAAPRSLTPEGTPEKREDPHVYTVVLGPGGAFRGRIGTLTDSEGLIAPAEGIAIRIVRAGNVVANVSTASDGTYSVEGITPGIYSIIAGGKKTLSAFSFRAIEARDDAPNGPQLETAGVSTGDIPLITDILGGAALPRNAGGDDLPDFPGTEGNAGFASGISVQTVTMDSDGIVQGWVHSLEGDQRHVHQMTVQFIRNNRTMAETKVDETGHFSISGLNPGTWSVVGVHPDGARFAVAVEILKPQPTDGDEFIPAGVLQFEEFAIAVVVPRNLAQASFEQLTENPVTEPADSNLDQIPDSPTGQPRFGNPLNPESGLPVPGNPAFSGGAPGVGGGSGLLETLIIAGGIWGLIETTDHDLCPASGSN